MLTWKIAKNNLRMAPSFSSLKQLKNSGILLIFKIELAFIIKKDNFRTKVIIKSYERREGYLID